MKKVYFVYRTTTHPYGGVNSFNRALRKTMNQNREAGFEPTGNIREADLVFLSAASRGPDARSRDLWIQPWQLQNLLARRRLYDPRTYLYKVAAQLPLVHRLDGLTERYGRQEGGTYDNLQKELNQFADVTIFQSKFCLESFRRDSLASEDRVIANGVDGDIFTWKPRNSIGPKLHAIAVSWSSNPAKGHALYSELSEHPSIEMTFIGRWPDNIPKKQIRHIPACAQTELVKHLHHADFFVHGATNDPAPNVVTEALATGLPVLYLNSGGTGEIVTKKRYGISLGDAETMTLKNGLDEMCHELSVLQEQVAADRESFLIQTTYIRYADAFREALNLLRTYVR